MHNDILVKTVTFSGWRLLALNPRPIVGNEDAILVCRNPARLQFPDETQIVSTSAGENPRKFAHATASEATAVVFLKAHQHCQCWRRNYRHNVVCIYDGWLQ
jgi:hypothetical protein